MLQEFLKFLVPQVLLWDTTDSKGDTPVTYPTTGPFLEVSGRGLELLGQ